MYKLKIQTNPLPAFMKTVNSNEILLSLTEGIFSIPMAEIVRLEARNNYTLFYFMNRKPLLSARVLRIYERLLQPHGFIRTHRSHLVNKQHIITADEELTGVFTHKGRACVSRRKKNQVSAVLNTIV